MEELTHMGFVFLTDKDRRFDTVAIDVKASGFSSADYLLSEFHKYGINLRRVSDFEVSISFDEQSTLYDLDQLLEIFHRLKKTSGTNGYQGFTNYEDKVYETLPPDLVRSKASTFLGQNQFAMKFSETNMMRYMHRLAEKDVSLTDAMIPLGSCTMKLNAAATMIPITWNGFSDLHPFVPLDQAKGYQQMIKEIEDNFIAITQYDGISSQPQSGATGEYAGLMAIRRYHESMDQGHRNVCLIPTSAHGTNPATANICGLKIVPVGCDELGNIQLKDV